MFSDDDDASMLEAAKALEMEQKKLAIEARKHHAKTVRMHKEIELAEKAFLKSLKDEALAEQLEREKERKDAYTAWNKADRKRRLDNEPLHVTAARKRDRENIEWNNEQQAKIIRFLNEGDKWAKATSTGIYKKY